MRTKVGEMNKLITLILRMAALIVCVNPAHAQDVTYMTLSEVIQTALSDNIDLKQSSNQSASYELSLIQAKADFYPAMSASVSLSRDYKMSHEVDIEDQTGALMRASLSSSLNLFNGFRDITAYEKARLEYASTKKNFDYQRQSIILTAINRFTEVVLKEELIGIEEENLETQRLQLDRIEAFYKAGNRPVSDVLQQKADISQAELGLLTARRDYQISYLQLLKILGREPTGDVKFVAPPLDSFISLIIGADSDLPIDIVFSQRSDMEAQKLHRLALEKDIKAARSALLPSASLSANVGSSYLNSSSAAGFADQFIDTNPSLGIGLSVSIPLFDRFQTKTSIEQARIKLSDQKLNVENLRLSIRLEIEQALLDYETAIKQREAAQAQLKYTEQALEASQARYEVGASTYTELSQVRAQYVSAANDRAQADWNLLLKYVAICYCRGNIDAAVKLFN